MGSISAHTLLITLWCEAIVAVNVAVTLWKIAILLHSFGERGKLLLQSHFGPNVLWFPSDVANDCQLPASFLP